MGLERILYLGVCPISIYLLHHQAGDRKGKVSNFRRLRDRKIGSGILSSCVPLSSVVVDKLGEVASLVKAVNIR